MIMVDWKEFLIKSSLVQRVYLVVTLIKYFLMRLVGKDFSAYCATLDYERIARTVSSWCSYNIIKKINFCLTETIKSSVDKNILLNNYVRSKESKKYREEFRMYGTQYQIRLKYPREHDTLLRQGDVLLLKPKISQNEKGVLLIQYNESFKKFVSIFDLKKLAESYRLVLEPSTWGYCDPSILFFLGLGTDVVVQAQHHLDYEYIYSLKSNLIPLRLGAGDWIDSDRFSSEQNLDYKKYDIVMVASWQKIKRHAFLFKNLQKIDNIIQKVALIGYPCGGRFQENIISDAKKYSVLQKIEIFENISREEVAAIVRHSKIGVMLTIREGANKGLYEYLFSGLPILITNRNIGVNRDHINQYTGIAVEDHALAEGIQNLIVNLKKYHPREWALKNTGYRYANNLLNECLKNLAIKNNEEWTQNIYMKKNDTNAKYVFDRERESADKEMEHLKIMVVAH